MIEFNRLELNNYIGDATFVQMQKSSHPFFDAEEVGFQCHCEER